MSSVTGNSRALSDIERRLTYSLEKHVPSMGRDGFWISTTYGEIWFEGADAVRLQSLVQALLSARLSVLQEEF